MNKFVFIILTVLLVPSAVYSAGYCPTPQELQSKMSYFQQRAIGNMNSNASLTQTEALMNEQERYIDSIFPSCIQYFKTAQNVDCSKLSTLATGYIMLDKSKQPAAKTQLNNLPSFQSKCSYQYDAFKMMVK